MATAVPAIIAAKERRIIENFRDAGATSPSLARTTIDVGIKENVGFRRLRRRDVIRETNPGFYYLDEYAWAAVRQIRRRVLIIVLTLILVAVALGTILGVLSFR